MKNENDILKNLIEDLKKMKSLKEKISFLEEKLKEVKNKSIKERIFMLIQLLKSGRGIPTSQELPTGGILTVEESSERLEDLVIEEERGPVVVSAEPLKTNEPKIQGYLNRGEIKADYIPGMRETEELQVGGYLRIEEESRGESNVGGEILSNNFRELQPKIDLKTGVDEIQNQIKRELIKKYKPRLKIEEED
ncbi:MAG: hypothetical protein OH319_02730 [Candidatus Parvarchaeota archaeon]|nr:hypothetical protein [Candidatus Jingweiarchaeum tengchongense]MCW1298284.1 hypothetical protein [Candidatus Jingweiarchaeum tengchongense]MCW1300375.1 hypothetical protein [Candidatus Jingweiarchaeum tengchongense]MCW1304780.1 hypothetical protein [Candidatus Jingweiarchaeum tengchongense]MCW1305370.1 hypothetical protein [Candidatus Jingweiarchaeum tengchongense]